MRVLFVFKISAASLSVARVVEIAADFVVGGFCLLLQTLLI